MKLSAADMKSYPRFHQYVRSAIPQLVNVPSVVHNLKKEGSLTDAEVRHALQWGSSPLIVILDLSTGSCGGIPAYGCTRAANPGQIEIDQGAVNDFEKDPYKAGCGVNHNGQKVFIVGVTLLHELCHWGKYKHNKAESTEAGFAFENATYGKAIP